MSCDQSMTMSWAGWWREAEKPQRCIQPTKKAQLIHLIRSLSLYLEEAQHHM
jgi:hypothetical protein